MKLVKKQVATEATKCGRDVNWMGVGDKSFKIDSECIVWYTKHATTKWDKFIIEAASLISYMPLDHFPSKPFILTSKFKHAKQAKEGPSLLEVWNYSILHHGYV
jgi:hypothetical protein